ncbi:MAG TPA: hypothetical protein VF369_07850, partial [candidate division Zixibacteria bacterium]
MPNLLSPVVAGISKDHRGLYLSIVLIGLIFFAGLYDSISGAWTSDDAFISFRYAQNLVEGKGLVYNAGERVEGYSNFLWTLLVVLGMELKLDPIDVTNALGVISFALTVLTFIYISWRLFKDNHPWGVFLPLTALCLLAQAHFREFATGGLETSFFTFLISLGFAGLIFSKSRRGYLLTGLALVLVALTRPDGIIFYVLSFLFLILTASFTPKRTLYFLVPLISIYIPYYILRFLYYGYPFSNIYYARSVNLAWWGQGFEYLFLYFKSYYVFWLLLALAVISAVKFRKSFKKLFRPPYDFDPIQKAVLLSLVFSLVFSLYLIRIGGDFMFARFFIPITPFLFFLMEAFVNQISGGRCLIPFGAAILLATYFYRYPQEIRQPTSKIVDERYFNTEQRIEEAKQKGAILKKYLKDTDARVVVFGSQAMLAYYAEFPTAIEGAAGLTDEYIAHLPVGERVRPGHEKVAPVEYLYQRGVNFAFVSGRWVPPTTNEFMEIYFGKVRGLILDYQRNLMRKLSAYPEVKFFDFES